MASERLPLGSRHTCQDFLLKYVSMNVRASSVMPSSLAFKDSKKKKSVWCGRGCERIDHLSTNIYLQLYWLTASTGLNIQHMRHTPGLENPTLWKGFLGSSTGKESACNAGDPGWIPGSGRSPGGGHGSLLQYSCLENSHGQMSLAGYSPWGRKESDMTEQLSTAQHCEKYQVLS